MDWEKSDQIFIWIWFRCSSSAGVMPGQVTCYQADIDIIEEELWQICFLFVFAACVWGGCRLYVIKDEFRRFGFCVPCPLTMEMGNGLFCTVTRRYLTIGHLGVAGRFDLGFNQTTPHPLFFFCTHSQAEEAVKRVSDLYQNSRTIIKQSFRTCLRRRFCLSNGKKGW